MYKVFCRGTIYQIINHRLYRNKECMFPARCSGVEYFLLQLLPKLPDVEFVLNTRDWPQVMKRFGPPKPVLSFSKASFNFPFVSLPWLHSICIELAFHSRSPKL